MIFTEEVDKILEILNVDGKTVDLYQKIEIERFVEELQEAKEEELDDAYDRGHEDGYEEAKDEYCED